MTKNYPVNITIGQLNSIFVGVINNIGFTSYYVLYVKLLNN